MEPGARRRTARGHTRARSTYPFSSSSETTAAGTQSPPACNSAKSDRLVAGLAQSAPAAAVAGRPAGAHRRIGPSSRLWAPRAFSQAALLAPDAWRLTGWPPPTAAPAAVDSRALRSSPLTWRNVAHSARRELEHESNAWLAISANGTLDIPFANRLGRDPASARSTQGVHSPSSSHISPSGR